MPPRRGAWTRAADGFTAVPGEGALATVEGKRLAVGNARLLAREGVSLDGLAQRAAELAGQGRTTVQVALDGHAAGVIAIADAPRETAKYAIAALAQLGVRAVMLTGDSRATAQRVAAEIGIEEVIAEVLPGDKEASAIPPARCVVAANLVRAGGAGHRPAGWQVGRRQDASMTLCPARPGSVPVIVRARPGSQS